MAAAAYVGDSPLFLLDYLLRLVRVIVLLALWRTILGGREPVGGVSLGAVLTYTLIAEVFAEQLAPRTSMDGALWDGSIIMRFLQPLGMFGQFTADAVGRWAFRFAIFSLPLLAISPLLGVNPAPASPSAAVWFLVSLPLAVSVGLAVEFIFGGLLVALQLEIWAVIQIRSAVTALLTGALVPLALLPWGLGEVFSWLPFAAMASAPLRVYTGTGEPLLLVASQLVWSVLLWPLAHWLWRANRERLLSYGG
ncbi:MAG TPA: ABC-2 family transporter protein [Chloroflexia bacterium]|nr:ABC-2 family transporter protein [Chloroflexia bacterium]